MYKPQLKTLVYYNMFQVLYDNGDSFNSLNMVLINCMQCNTVILRLAPDTTYTIRVEAVTKSNKLLEIGEIHVTTILGG